MLKPLAPEAAVCSETQARSPCNKFKVQAVRQWQHTSSLSRSMAAQTLVLCPKQPRKLMVLWDQHNCGADSLCVLSRLHQQQHTSSLSRSIAAHTLVLCPKQPRKLMGCRSSGIALHESQKLNFLRSGSGTPQPSVRACTPVLL